MKAITKVLAGGVAIAALAGAAPAAAQYYPGYGGGLEQVLAQVIGGPGYGAPYGGYGYNGYGPGMNSQAAISQCVGAVQQRLNGGYAGYGYGAPYGGGYGNARVLGISRVEPRSDGGLTVRGVANSGRNAGYAYGYGYNGGQPPIDLTFNCRADYRGFVYDVDIDPAQSNYASPYTNGYNYSPYGNNAYDYSQYGYRRY